MSDSPFPAPPPLLSTLNTAELGALHRCGVDLKIPAGTTLIEQGKEQDRLYVIFDGRLVVSRSNAGQTVELAELRGGEIFGEMSVLEPGSASATVTSSAESQLWFIERGAFDGFLRDNPDAGVRILREVAKALSSRVRGLDENMENRGGRLAEGWW